MELQAGEREVEMRVGGIEISGREDAVRAEILALDPGARVRIDGATGILHAITRRDSLELAEALNRAGFDATAMTG